MDLFQKMRIRFNVPSPERQASDDEERRSPSIASSAEQPTKLTASCLKVTSNLHPNEIKSSPPSFERKQVSLKRSKAVNPMSVSSVINSADQNKAKMNLDIKCSGQPPLGSPGVNPVAGLARAASMTKGPPLPPRPSRQDTLVSNHVDPPSNDPNQLDTQEWRKRGKEMVDYIADYMDTINDRRVTPNVEPGYLKPLLPDSAPYKSECWDKIMADFETFIMPGVTHWQHSRFHAYFPAGNSYPSILADMITDAIGCIGFSWVCFPFSFLLPFFFLLLLSLLLLLSPSLLFRFPTFFQGP